MAARKAAKKSSCRPLTLQVQRLEWPIPGADCSQQVERNTLGFLFDRAKKLAAKKLVRLRTNSRQVAIIKRLIFDNLVVDFFVLASTRL